MPVLDLTIDGPFDLERTLAIHRRGTGDPSLRFDPGGIAWRASRTADGPAVMRIRRTTVGVRAEAWGPGADAALAGVPALVGGLDRPILPEPAHPVVRDLARRLAGVRIGRTGAVLDALVPAILEQKVIGQQARRGYQLLVRRYGEPAPRADLPGAPEMMLPPEPACLVRLPYWAFHPFGIERRRADTVRRVAAVAASLEATVGLPPAEAYARLRAIVGVGPWTAAEVGIRALGDPDAVSVGDFHLPGLVAWALAGEARADDARMLELLEPYRGQRGLVLRMLELAGPRPPSFGPRMALRHIEAD